MNSFDAHPLTDAVSPRLRVGLFGCSLDTGNRGVSALAYSIIAALANVAPGTDIALFDFGKGYRDTDLPAFCGNVHVGFVGCNHPGRYYSTNLAQAYLAARLGLGSLHPMVRRLARLDTILDVSGGDSFS